MCDLIFKCVDATPIFLMPLGVFLFWLLVFTISFSVRVLTEKKTSPTDTPRSPLMITLFAIGFSTIFMAGGGLLFPLIKDHPLELTTVVTALIIATIISLISIFIRNRRWK